MVSPGHWHCTTGDSSARSTSWRQAVLRRCPAGKAPQSTQLDPPHTLSELHSSFVPQGASGRQVPKLEQVLPAAQHPPPQEMAPAPQRSSGGGSSLFSTGALPPSLTLTPVLSAHAPPSSAAGSSSHSAAVRRPARDTFRLPDPIRSFMLSSAFCDSVRQSGGYGIR
jgi:hypothetical protein